MARLLWVLALVALVALVFYAMRRGWTGRSQRQAAELPEFPAPPTDLGAELLTATGFYVGTTKAADWQDRIAVGDIGHRATATAHLHATGLLLEREGASALWIPTDSIVDSRHDHKLANKVIPGKGLIVVTWRLGEQQLDTGFRGDEATAQDDWVEAIRALTVRGDAGSGQNRTSRQEEK